MNDLLPPARRSIPEQRRKRMRDKLDAEISSTTTVNRRDGAVRRYGIPAVVAAAAAALALGGYLIASDDGDGDNGIDPTGQGDRDSRPDQGGKHQPKTEQGGQAPASTVLADPDQAYQKCIDHATRQYELRGEPIGGELTGRIAIDNGVSTTVVVANSTDSYSCNVKPDKAVSRPGSLDGTAQASDFWFALNVTSNTLPGAKGDMAWAGGELPQGVTGVTYTFPDGHTEQAVVEDGFWAMQYFSDRTIPTGPNDRVEVTLDGSDSQAFELPFNINTMCNQVSHGC